MLDSLRECESGYNSDVLIDPVVLSVIAIVVSILSAAISFRSTQLSKRSLQAPSFLEFMSSFRDEEFHKKFDRILADLPDVDSSIPLFDIPDDSLRRDTIDVVYFFQNCASFADFRLLDQKLFMVFLHGRVPRLWRVVAP